MSRVLPVVGPRTRLRAMVAWRVRLRTPDDDWWTCGCGNSNSGRPRPLEPLTKTTRINKVTTPNALTKLRWNIGSPSQNGFGSAGRPFKQERPSGGVLGPSTGTLGGAVGRPALMRVPDSCVGHSPGDASRVRCTAQACYERAVATSEPAGTMADRQAAWEAVTFCLEIEGSHRSLPLAPAVRADCPCQSRRAVGLHGGCSNHRKRRSL